jgi:hypothetical protein
LIFVESMKSISETNSLWPKCSPGYISLYMRLPNLGKTNPAVPRTRKNTKN